MTSSDLSNESRPDVAAEPAWRLSRVAVGAAGVLALAGVLSGVAVYRAGLPPQEQVPGTSAWLPHLGLTAVGAGWLLALVVQRRRGARLLLAPLGRRATARLAATFRSGGFGPTAMLRRLGSGLLVVVLGYCCWRAGLQVTGGLDPGFTANAWGGPSYLGAMFCHYVDCAWLIGVSAALLNLLLVRPRHGSL